MPALASLAATLAVLLLVCTPVGAPRVDSAVAAPATTSGPVSTPGRPDAGLAEGPGAAKRPSLGSQPLPGVPSVPSVEPVALVGPPTAIGPLGIPAIVLTAYQRAAATLAEEQPRCHLPWWLLAGIGQVESGQAEGGRVFPDGTTRGTILGPLLDGHVPGDAIIRDTDGGKLDGSTRFDRAVGPMQFIPSTWARWGADGNADGRSDPNNIFDAALAAARYLCADTRDLGTTPGITAAIRSYNPLPAYLRWVLSWAYGYRDGVITVPVSALPVVVDVTTARPALVATARAPEPAGKSAPTTPSTNAPTVVALAHASPTTSAEPTSSVPATGTAGPTSTLSAGPTSTVSATPTPTVSAAPTTAAAGGTACTATASASASATPSASSDPSATGRGPSGSVTTGANATSVPAASADGAATSGAVPSATADPSAGDTPVRCP